jgi:hypothetical protein
MRYGFWAAGFWAAVKKRFRRELALLLGPRDAGLIMRAAKGRYREMILRLPPLGGGKNPFTMNILAAAWGASLYLAGKDVLSPEEMGGVFSRAIENNIVFRLVMKSRSKKVFTAGWQDRWRKLAIASRALPNPAGFVFEFIPGETRNEYGVHFKQCGICRLFQREGCSEFAPYMCRFDFVMARHMNCRLTRPHTIANGDGFCDFWYSKIYTIVNSADPIP